jgi:SAM-dependent methyltransferase
LSTLPRTPEPELMEEAEQARADAEADFGATDAAFVDAFLARFGTPRRVIDLGCGPGNIALRLCRPGVEVWGVDGAAAMLAHGRARSDAVRWLEATLPSDALPSAHFDAVVSNSLLHHLHDPSVLWRTLRQVAAPGAAVLVGDLRRPRTEAALEALVAREAGDAPEVLRRDFRASLHAAFTPDEVRGQLADAGIEGLVVETPTDRHLWVGGRLR